MPFTPNRRSFIIASGMTALASTRVLGANDMLRVGVIGAGGRMRTILDSADKSGIPHYVEWSLKLSHLGTLIVVDNVIRDGALIDDKDEDPNVKGARRLHEMLASEPRLSATTIQTVGSKGYDGFTLALVTMDVT